MQTLTIKVDDSYLEKVLAVLGEFPQKALSVTKLNPIKAQIQNDIQAYDRKELSTTPLDKDFWDEMNQLIDNVKSDEHP